MALKAPKVNSEEHELELLGMALIDGDSAKKVASIPTSLFYYSRHRDIHKVISMLSEQGKNIDQLALITKLGGEYALTIADLTMHGLNTETFTQRVNELKEIRLQHKVANLSHDTSLEELEELIEKYKPEQEEDRSYIPNKDDLLEKILVYRTTGGLKLFSPGFDIKENYQIAKGQLSVVTGIPGSGKSTWIDNVVVNMAKEHGWKFCIFSPESYPIEQHYARMIEIHSGLTMLQKGETSVPKMSEKTLRESYDFIYNHIDILYIPPEERTLDGIMGQVGRDYDGFVLDPWNEIEHRRKSDLTETEYIGETLMRLKAYAVFNDFHIWLIAHPKKLQKDENDKYKAPEPYDISGSANWYNKADMCLTVHRPDPHSFDRQRKFQTDIHIKKVRVRGTGKLGVIAMTFNYDNQRYTLNDYQKTDELPF